MSLFAITMHSPKPMLIAAVKSAGLTHYEVSDNLIVVRAKMSAKELTDSLAVHDTERNGLVIFQITADYYGYAAKAFWDWYAVQIREDAGG